LLRGGTGEDAFKEREEEDPDLLRGREKRYLMPGRPKTHSRDLRLRQCCGRIAEEETESYHDFERIEGRIVSGKATSRKFSSERSNLGVHIRKPGGENRLQRGEEGRKT